LTVFYFEHLLSQALNSIDGTSIIGTITNIAFAILLVGFLVGLYQAALRGGDLQALAVTAIKYLVVAMIISHWTSVFRDVNGSFTSIADFVSNSSSAGDMFANWMTQLQQQSTTNPNLTFWDMITGDIPGTIRVGLLLVAYVIYALAIIIFCFFYTLYGTVLYVIGPLVLTLIPISGIGQLGRTYAINLMIWNAWAILYSVFGSLITAIHFNQVDQVLGNGFLGFLQGVPDSTILGLVSIFYALAIVIIPFIAKGMIAGDVGSTAMSFVRAASAAVGAALAAVSGFGAGAVGAPAVAGATAGAGGGSGAMALFSSTPPPVPANSVSNFLQSGFSSMNSGVSPVTPAGGSAGKGNSGKQNSSARAASPDSRSSNLYSPKNVTQAVTFHAGRALARVASRDHPEDD
jgi:hypothetical protein